MEGTSIGKFLIFSLAFTTLVCFIISPATATGTKTLITTYSNGFYHQFPRIYNDQIVWQDINPSNTYGIIYVYNITSGVETQVTDDTGYAVNPAIFGDLISYTYCGNYLSYGTSSTIYLYNIATTTRTPVSSGSDWQDFSALYGNKVVWVDTPTSGVSQIYMNDTSTNLTTLINASLNNQAYPAIFNDLVTYADCGSDQSCESPSTIYLYNVSSGTRTQISPGSNWNAYPAIFGNQIVWQNSDTYGDPSQIFINGTAPGNGFSLTPNQPMINHQDPAISGNWVVWFQTNATTGNSDIYVNDTSMNQTIPIALNRNGVELTSIAYSPAQSLYRIVWDELDASGYNVYLYTNTSNGVCPVASFTNDFTGGSAPATVNFTDTSSQDPSITHWFWDFGDGSNSTQQNPAHAYTANGVYTVSLTVSNSLCRNTTTVTNSVVVGQPVAGFTASPTTNVVPATIAFTDTSLGTPTQWNWSWGDGTWSNGTTPLQQNPVHIYNSPGTYNVSLTATNTYGSNTLTKTNYITVLAGANVLANTTINGITIQNSGSQQYLVFNYTTLPDWTFYPNSSVLDFEPPPDSGFQNISIYTSEPGGFVVFPGNTTIAGTISNVKLQTADITPTGFSSITGNCSINYSIDLSSYPQNAVLNTQLWEGATVSDALNFNAVAAGSGFGGTNQTAYTIKIIKTNFPAGGTAILHMSLNASWVATKPSGTNDVFVERIDDSGTYGQVLGTHFLYYNSTNNLDYFEVDSPKGLSTFGLSFLQGTGNLFQIITLVVSNEIQSPANTRYAGSGSWSGSGNSPPTYAPTAVQTNVAPQATVSSHQTAANPVVTFNPIPAPPAPTALSTDVGIMGWLAETFGGHIYLVGAGGIAVMSLIYIRRRRRRFDPLG